MKAVRVICITEALRGTEAEKFKRASSRHFNGKYVFSGRYGLNGSKQRLPLYYVVRKPLPNEPIIDKHEMKVKWGKLLERIMKYRVNAK